MHWVGSDLHERTSSICVLDDRGQVVQRARIDGHPREVIAWLGRLGVPFRVCFEASTSFGWVHDALAPIAESVVVAHPGRLRLIFRSKRKNDRADAEKLARLLYLGEVPAIHVPSRDVRSWRRLIEHRKSSVGDRSRIKCRLRALLRSYGVSAPRGMGLWSKRGLAWLAEVDLPTSGARLERDQARAGPGSSGTRGSTISGTPTGRSPGSSASWA